MNSMYNSMFTTGRSEPYSSDPAMARFMRRGLPGGTGASVGAPGMMAGQYAQGGTVGTPPNLGYFGTNTNQGGPVDNGLWSTVGNASGPAPDYASQYAAADASRVATPGFASRQTPEQMQRGWGQQMQANWLGGEDYQTRYNRIHSPAGRAMMNTPQAGGGQGGEFTVGRMPGTQGPSQQGGTVGGQSNASSPNRMMAVLGRRGY
jgi:hypothetical protein